MKLHSLLPFLNMALLMSPLTFAQAATPSVSTGAIQGAALSSDGVVYAWGDYKANSMGIRQDATTAKPAALLTDGVEVAAGYYHTLARKADGSVWAWGSNANKQLGQQGANGYTTRSATPLQISGLGSVTQLAAGGYHSLALRNDGTVLAWGANSYGQSGNNDAAVTKQATPAAVPGLTNVTALAAGWGHSLALDGNGRVWGWGSNTYRQLGVVSGDTSVYRPVALTGLPRIQAVAAGGYHSLALAADGTVWAWGQNLRGQLGMQGASDAPPAPIPGLGKVRAIAAGYQHSLALTEDGGVWAWGEAMGSGQAADAPKPVRLNSAKTMVALTAGMEHSTALDSEGLVWSWGNNHEGQLGDGTFARSRTAVITLNATADGALDLKPGTPKTYPAEAVPAVLLSLSLDANNLSVTLTDPVVTVFSGEVYVTALLKSSSTLLSAVGTVSGGVLTPVCFTAAGLVRCGPGDSAKPLVSGTLQRGQALNVMTAADFERFRKNDGLGRLSAWFVPSGSAFKSVARCGAKQPCSRDVGDGNQFADGIAIAPPNPEISVDTQGSPLTRRSVIAKISARATAKTGSAALICSWATVPNADGSISNFMQPGANAWVPFERDAMPLIQATGGADGITWPVIANADLSGIKGTLVYIGFGQAGEKCGDIMQDPTRFSLYHTVL